MGMSRSGKTTLLLNLAKHFIKDGYAVLVLDPFSYPSKWPTQYVFKDSQEFLTLVKRSRECILIVDEAGDSCGQFDKEMHFLSTQSRHYGHSVIFGTQRGAQIAKTIRDNCEQLFLFASSMDDCKILSREFNRPELTLAKTLKRGQYLNTGRFSKVRRYQLFETKED